MNLFLEMEIARAVLSVSELNRSAKDLLERAFPLLWVAGEISNLKRYASGHWYFTLHDGFSQLKAACEQMLRLCSRYNRGAIGGAIAFQSTCGASAHRCSRS